MTDAAHLNNLVAQARTEAEQHLPELEEAYTKILRGAGRSAAAAFKQQVVTAAVNPWEPPPGDLVDTGTLAENAAKVTPIHKRLLKAVTPAEDLGVAYDIHREAPQALLAGLAGRLGSLGSAIREQVEESVRDGHQQGWSVAKTAGAIVEKVDSVAPARAAALARTDLNALSNGSSLDLARQVGVTAKTWLATDDDRTRETHAEADGQTVPVDQPFTVGGEQAMYPGDPDLSDEEAFNCRCAVTYGDSLEAAATAEGGNMDDDLTLTAAASGDTGLPLSDRDRAWDSAAATGRLKKWASSDGSGDPDTIDYGKLGRGFFWKDGDGSKIGDFKFPFADIVGGKLTAVWKGVTAGAQRLSSAKGVDTAAIQKKMAVYYEKAASQFDDDTIKAPWDDTQTASGALEDMTSAELRALASDATARADEIDRLTAVLTEIELTAAADGPTGWRATLLVEDEVTEDGRLILPGATSWRSLPLTLGLMMETPHSYETDAPACGRIDMIWRAGNAIQASGVFSDNSDDPELAETGRQAVAAIREGVIRGVSVDLAVLDGDTLFIPDALDPASEDELPPEVDDDLVPIVDGQPAEVVDVIDPPPAGRYVWAVNDGVIGSACIVPFPAIAQATIEVVTAAAGFEIVRATRSLFGCGCDGLTAAAAPLRPPASWFADPKLEKPTPLTVTDDGRVYGHIALWASCHTGYQGRCVPPPRSSSGYTHFHTGEIETDDGERVRIGKITVATGHAGTSGVSASQARAHYDNTGSVAAFVRAGEDRFGPWVAGALKSDITPELRRDLMANGPSGDWRNSEMIAVLAVPTQGFPVLRASALDGDGEEVETALILQSPLTAGTPVEVSPLARIRPARRAKAAV